MFLNHNNDFMCDAIDLRLLIFAYKESKHILQCDSRLMMCFVIVIRLLRDCVIALLLVLKLVVDFLLIEMIFS